MSWLTWKRDSLSWKCIKLKKKKEEGKRIQISIVNPHYLTLNKDFIQMMRGRGSVNHNLLPSEKCCLLFTVPSLALHAAQNAQNWTRGDSSSSLFPEKQAEFCRYWSRNMIVPILSIQNSWSFFILQAPTPQPHTEFSFMNSVETLILQLQDGGGWKKMEIGWK